jgi:hypothetical protein
VAFHVRSHWTIAAAVLASSSAISPSSARVTTTYAYDALGQVTRVQRANGAIGYGYDARATACD